MMLRTPISNRYPYRVQGRIERRLYYTLYLLNKFLMSLQNRRNEKQSLSETMNQVKFHDVNFSMANNMIG